MNSSSKLTSRKFDEQGGQQSGSQSSTASTLVNANAGLPKDNKLIKSYDPKSQNENNSVDGNIIAQPNTNTGLPKNNPMVRGSLNIKKENSSGNGNNDTTKTIITTGSSRNNPSNNLKSTAETSSGHRKGKNEPIPLNTSNKPDIKETLGAKSDSNEPSTKGLMSDSRHNSNDVHTADCAKIDATLIPKLKSSASSSKTQPNYSETFEQDLSKVESITDITSEETISRLSISKMKIILEKSSVNFKDFTDKREFVEKMHSLWKSSQAKDNEQWCKICFNSPINSVFLECGHMMSCVDCAFRIKECPLCRNYITRVVRVFHD